MFVVMFWDWMAPLGWGLGLHRRWDGWLALTRFRRLISPTAGGFALGFLALISHVWGHDARNMARGGRGDCSD
jgi:hypothetical protein